MKIAYGRDSLGNLGFWGAYPIIEAPDTITLFIDDDGFAKGSMTIRLKMFVPAKTQHYAYRLQNEEWFCAGQRRKTYFQGFAAWHQRTIQLRIANPYNVVVSGGVLGDLTTGKVFSGNRDLGTRKLTIKIPPKVLKDFPPKGGTYKLEIKAVFRAVSYVYQYASPICIRFADSNSCSLKIVVTAYIKPKTKPPAADSRTTIYKESGQLNDSLGTKIAKVKIQNTEERKVKSAKEKAGIITEKITKTDVTTKAETISDKIRQYPLHVAVVVGIIFLAILLSW